MRQELTFNTRDEGIAVLDAMSDILNRSGFVRAAELNALVGVTGKYKDESIGWKSLDGVETFQSEDKFVISFPEPKTFFEGMDPKEINFVTHPFWLEMERQIRENENFAYTIAQEGKPIAVIISAEAFEKAKEALEQLSP